MPASGPALPMTAFTESEVEAAALEWLEGLGWHVAYGPDIGPDGPAAERADHGAAVLERRLRDALARLNPDLPAATLDDAFRRLTRPEGTTLETRNRAFHRMTVEGVNVEYRNAEGALRGAQVKVIDFDDPGNDDWLAVNQFTMVENGRERRPDIVLFVNGLPLGIIELKNPADEDATVWTAWRQLETYRAEIPSLFAMNAALVVSDGRSGAGPGVSSPIPSSAASAASAASAPSSSRSSRPRTSQTSPSNASMVQSSRAGERAIERHHLTYRKVGRPHRLRNMRTRTVAGSAGRTDNPPGARAVSQLPCRHVLPVLPLGSRAAVRGLSPQVRGGRCRLSAARAEGLSHNGFHRPADGAARKRGRDALRRVVRHTRRICDAFSLYSATIWVRAARQSG